MKLKYTSSETYPTANYRPNHQRQHVSQTGHRRSKVSCTYRYCYGWSWTETDV